MKLIFLITFVIVTLLGCVTNQNTPTVTTAPENDAWVGRYRLTWMKGTPAAEAGAPDLVFSIARVPDADPNKMTVKEREVSLARWTLSSGEQNMVLRRFHPNDYEGLNTAGGIECLDGGNVFFCRVKPGTIVKGILARTGFFGVVLHEGGFELTKLDSTP